MSVGSAIAAAASLPLNIGYSMQAVKHVLIDNKLQGANWDYYQSPDGAGTFEHYSKQARETAGGARWLNTKLAIYFKNKVDVCLYDTVRPNSNKEMAEKNPKSELEVFRIIAAQAAANGCGNCGESSILAFVFLYDLGVRPLDWFGTDADHAFVVIGRAKGDENDDKSWGPAAAVCDPWAQGMTGKPSDGTYAGVQFKNKMRSLIGAFRIDRAYREG